MKRRAHAGLLAASLLLLCNCDAGHAVVLGTYVPADGGSSGVGAQGDAGLGADGSVGTPGGGVRGHPGDGTDHDHDDAATGVLPGSDAAVPTPPPAHGDDDAGHPRSDG
ncbi:MAG TPA: hypothetical protein VF331_01220 [Polyangiales bacterium]